MSSPFVAEIRIFPFNFAPRGWAFCDGQLMPISQNTALFSLLGTNYGGNGQSTFALPNLQGSAALHPGQGPGFSFYNLGQSGGSDTVTRLPSEIPAHAHALMVSKEMGEDRKAAGEAVARSTGGPVYGPVPANPVAMAATGIAPAGGDF